MPFDQKETAELIVEGQRFRDWETIRVEREFGVLPHTCMFTTSEAAPGANVMASLQIKPGDKYEIKLAGMTAQKGYINIRQSSYDAHRHGVMIQGRSYSQDPVDSSVMFDRTKNELKGQTFQGIANNVLKPYGMSIECKGDAASKPFERERIIPGESCFSLLERLARSRELYLGEDFEGNLLAISGPEGEAGQLVEGQNILSARVTINDTFISQREVQLGQRWATDDYYGKPPAQIKDDQTVEAVKRLREKTSISNKPVTTEEAKLQNKNNIIWNAAVVIEATIMVQGWLASGGGGLWKEGQTAKVKSKMAMLDQSLFIQKVTFGQDNAAGTHTILQLNNWPKGAIILPSPSIGAPQSGEGGQQ